jgi:hypothetical protein
MPQEGPDYAAKEIEEPPIRGLKTADPAQRVGIIRQSA